MNPWLLNLIAAGGLLALFTGLWAWCQRTRNASWVDVAWAFGMLLPVGWAAGLNLPRGVASWVLLGLAGVWAGRLGGHLARRVAREHPREDARYAALRGRWGNHPAKWWGVFAAQVGVILVLVQPWLLLLRLDPLGWAWTQSVGATLVLAGIGGEALADRQLREFRAKPAGQRGDGVCRVGLWGWSRHPNYLFESVSWWGFWVFCRVPGTEWGPWLACGAAPVTMFVLLRFVTGVPPAERSSLKSKPEAFRRYQQEVSVFWPWFPKR